MSAPTPTGFEEANWKDHDDAVDGQARAAKPEAFAWVTANAGSGKTTVLINRVARLLLTGVKPDSILCVTYTKAAASEMQRRLFERLGDWTVMPEPELKTALASLQGRHPDDYQATDLGEARNLFAKALETPGGLRIETIHAFCARILRRFPLEAGVPPGFSELDDDGADQLWLDAFHALGARLLSGDPELTEAARIAAEAGGAHALDALRALDASRSLILRFIAETGGLEPAIEALRHQLDASAEDAATLMERAMGSQLPHRRLQTLMGKLPTAKPTDAALKETLAHILSNDPAEHRFEAYARLVFTERGELRSRNPYTSEAALVVPDLYDLLNVKDAPQGAEIQRILAVAEAISARRIFERSAALLRLASEAFDAFNQRKRNRAQLDFEDLIQMTRDLLSVRSAAEWVLWKLDGGLTHMLLDEAQDTSPPQWEILNALTAEFFAGAGAVRKDLPANPRTAFVVGDPKQSIYSFQGADPDAFLAEGRAFADRARHPNAALETPALAMSFRSAPEILRFVDAAFDTSAFDGEDPFSLDPPVEADLMRHTAHRRAAKGVVELWPIAPRADAAPSKPWDAPQGQANPASPRVRLASQIAAFIRREIDAGTAIDARSGPRAVCAGDFLILVKRRTGGLFDALLQALKREGLPVAGADRILLLDSLAVQDMLNLVRFALCPEDDLTLAEILKGPFGGLDDDRDLFPLAHGREPGERLWTRLQASRDPNHTRICDFLLDVLRRRHDAPLEFLVHALERRTALRAPGWELILSRFGAPAREPVTALIDRAAAFDTGGPASLELFLAAVERQGGELKRELSQPADDVRVMTVHGAKGLEAPVVILPDTTSPPRSGVDKLGVLVSESGAPIWAGARTGDCQASRILRARADARSLREHRRLLYVGLTRAEDRLVICGAWRGKSKFGWAERSWYGVCEGAMQRLAAAGAAAKDTVGVIRLGADPVALGRARARPIGDRLLPKWIDKPAPRSETARRILAPSSIGGAEPPVMSPFGAGRAERLARGRAIHLLFEALPSVPPADRRAAAQRFLDRDAAFTPAQRREMVNAALAVMEDTAFAAVFGPGGRAEAPVIGELEGAIINGRVDRLVITPGEILIVDYKTDRPAPADLSGVGEAYIIQLAAYRAILSRLSPGEGQPARAVRCVLVWTDGPKLMEIPEALMDEALQRAFP